MSVAPSGSLGAGADPSPVPARIRRQAVAS